MRSARSAPSSLNPRINLAEGAKSAAIAESEGQKQAAINRAEGEAQATLLVAEATAEAIRKVVEQYIAAFANIAKQGNTILLPANVGDVAGMVATAMSVISRKG